MSSVFRCVMGVIFNRIVVLTAPWVAVRRTSQYLCTLVIIKEEIRRVYLLLFQVRNAATTQNQCVDSPVGEEHHNKAVIPYPCHRQGGNQVQKTNRAFIQTDIHMHLFMLPNIATAIFARYFKGLNVEKY